METNYNLTTKNGFEKAMKLFDKYGWAISPAFWLLKKVFSPEITTEKQAEIARKLIVEGRNQGVKKMHIKVSHDAGIDLGTNVEGIPIKVKAGNNGCMEVDVEYS